jgi:class 3 adenylate cyclase
VTVLFADVVHSMDIAKAVGAERLREIMTGLADRCAAVVRTSAGRWTSSPATGSWRCSVHRSRWKTTLLVPAWPP